MYKHRQIPCGHPRLLPDGQPPSPAVNGNVPALRQLAGQASLMDICQSVESVFGQTPRLSRKVKVFPCREHTMESLAAIGDRFGIGDSAAAQSDLRFLNEIKPDRRLRRQVDQMEKIITVCIVVTP